MDRYVNPTDTAQLNEALNSIWSKLGRAVHCWFSGHSWSVLTHAPTNAGEPSEEAVDEWRDAVFSLHNLVMQLACRKCRADERTLALLSSLAVHPAPVVRLKASAGILAAGWAPPYSVVCEMLAGASPSGITGLDMVPREFWYIINAHKGRVWEDLCVRLAEVVHDSVLTAARNETLCVNGGRPDIVVADQSILWEGGRLASVNRIMDAKCGLSGQFEKSITKYQDICRHLEFWIGVDTGARIDPRPNEQVGGCQIVYRYLDELIDMAREHGAPKVAETMALFRRSTGHFSMLSIYLRLVKRQLEQKITLDGLDADDLADISGACQSD